MELEYEFRKAQREIEFLRQRLQTAMNVSEQKINSKRKDNDDESLNSQNSSQRHNYENKEKELSSEEVPWEQNCSENEDDESGCTLQSDEDTLEHESTGGLISEES